METKLIAYCHIGIWKSNLSYHYLKLVIFLFPFASTMCELNFHWRWRWWDWIQGTFKNLFYLMNFNIQELNLIKLLSFWLNLYQFPLSHKSEWLIEKKKAKEVFILTSILFFLQDSKTWHGGWWKGHQRSLQSWKLWFGISP